MRLAALGEGEVLLAVVADPARGGLGVDTDTTLGEALPDVALVGTTGELAVSVEDGVTGGDEGRVAGLAGVTVSFLILEG